MGRDPTKHQTPDLFSTERLGDPSSDRSAGTVAGRPSRRAVLPKDLPRAIRFLEDRELDWLLRVATQEAKRRGRPLPMTEASPTNTSAASSEPTPRQPQPPGRPTRQRQIRPAAASLSRGQVNAVRASFKAGVTPSRIARQFGLSQSDVHKALSYDEPSDDDGRLNAPQELYLIHRCLIHDEGATRRFVQLHRMLRPAKKAAEL